MPTTASNSLFVLKLIGSLFSIFSILVTGAIIYLLTAKGIPDNETAFNSFVVSSAILAVSSATIAFFVWWIISNRKRFLNTGQ